jgi:tryptophanase
MDRCRTIIEPFRIHAVEPVRITTREERVAAIEAAGRTPGPGALRRFTARFEPVGPG